MLSCESFPEGWIWVAHYWGYHVPLSKIPKNACSHSDITCQNQKSDIEISLERDIWGLPRQSRGKESTCQCRRHGFDPWFRKISHVTRRLSPWASATEPAHCNSSSPHAPEATLCPLQLLKPTRSGGHALRTATPEAHTLRRPRSAHCNYWSPHALEATLCKRNQCNEKPTHWN